jgi:hypothetical protein
LEGRVATDQAGGRSRLWVKAGRWVVSATLAFATEWRTMSVRSAVPASFAKDRSSQQVVLEVICKACMLCVVDLFCMAALDMFSQCSMPGVVPVEAVFMGMAMRAQLTLQATAND